MAQNFFSFFFRILVHKNKKKKKKKKKKGKNIDKLLEAILAEAEVLELTADQTGPVEGIILESKVHPQKGYLFIYLFIKSNSKF